VAVLGAATIVSVIGLASVLLGRVRLRVTTQAGQVIAARHYAQAAVERALYEINADSSWPYTMPIGSWTPELDIGQGSCSWMITPIVGGYVSPEFILLGKGTCQDASRIYKVRLIPDEASDTQLVDNPSLEDGLSGWQEEGGSDISLATSTAHSGSNSLLVTDREDWYSGAGQSITDKITNGTQYDIVGWVRSRSNWSRAKFCFYVEGSSSGGRYFTNHSATTDLRSDRWTMVSYTVTLYWSGELIRAWWKIEGDSSTSPVDFYIDDVIMKESGTFTLPQYEISAGSWEQQVMP
jgi:hypothetical protein